MNSLLVFYLFMIQTFNTVEDPGKGTAFAGYIDFFADTLLIAGSILAIMSAYRIYQKAMLTGENIMNGSTNLIVGMILCLLTGAFIKANF